MVGIIHCTKLCNLACRYCFEKNWQMKGYELDYKKINTQFEEALDMLIQFAVDLSLGYQNEQVDIILHGGEPLLIEIAHIEKLFKYVSSVCENVRFFIQTNGTVLSKKHLSIFQQYNVGVGVSIDGPEHIHDCFRKDKEGKGTFKKIIKNYTVLKKEEIDVGALVTFNQKNIENIEETYRFFSKNDINFAFNPFFQPSDDNYSDVCFKTEEYSKAICQMYDLWINDKTSNISIRNFERILDGLLNKEHSIYTCSGCKNCAEKIVAIDLQGKIYPCNHFCGTDSYSYAHFDDGNICQLIHESNPFKHRWAKLKLKKCGTCDIADYCHGGCPYHSLIRYGSTDVADEFCADTKKIIHHIYKKMNAELKND